MSISVAAAARNAARGCCLACCDDGDDDDDDDADDDGRMCAIILANRLSLSATSRIACSSSRSAWFSVFSESF